MRGMMKLIALALFGMLFCSRVCSEVVERTGKSDRSLSCNETSAAVESPVEIVVPLKDGAFHLGDVLIRLDGRHVFLDHKSFMNGVKSLLRPEVVNGAPSPDPNSLFVSLQTLCQSGLKLSFDPSAVQLLFFPTVDQRVRGKIDSGVEKMAAKGAKLKPASLSGYVNNVVSLDYDHLNSASDRFGGRIDFDGAVAWNGWVLEGEVGFSPTLGFGYLAKRLIFDDTETATRFTLGDYYPVMAGYQTSSELAGISVQRAYSKLAPDKNIRPTGKRSFRIEKPSSVTVYVNNNLARRLRLGPGEYDLSDLPLRGGTNMITLDIESDTGEKSKLEFTVFFNRSLLAPGVDEFGANAGLSRRSDADGLFAVDDSLFFSGFYRLGLTEAVTTEFTTQMSHDVVLAGGGVIVQTVLGFVNVDAAVTMSNDWRDAGVALSADFDSVAFRPLGGPETSLKISAEMLSEDFVPGGQASPDYRLDLSSALVQRWSSDVSTMIGASYVFGAEPLSDRVSFDFSINRTVDADTTVSLSAGWERSLDEDEASSFAMVRIGHRVNDSTQLGYALDATRGGSTATLDHQSGHGVGAWSFSGEMESAPSTADGAANLHSVGGSLNYTANRAEISVSHDRDFLGLGSDLLSERSSFRIGSAIAFTDDAFAVGRPISNGFAIVDAHKSLDGKTISIGAGPDSVQASSDGLGSALVPEISPYSLSHLAYDVEDLPAGYDLGTGVFEIFAAHRSGYHLTVGSGDAVMARGVLMDTSSKPIGLLTGVIRSKSPETAKPIDIFTTETGAFFAQGLSPGHWVIEIGEDPKFYAEFSINNDITGVVELNELKASLHE